jgi:hypothetical protein
MIALMLGLSLISLISLLSPLSLTSFAQGPVQQTTANLGVQNVFTQTNTFPNIIDTGLTANGCVSVSSSTVGLLTTPAICLVTSTGLFLGNGATPGTLTFQGLDNEGTITLVNNEVNRSSNTVIQIPNPLSGNGVMVVNASSPLAIDSYGNMTCSGCGGGLTGSGTVGEAAVWAGSASLTAVPLTISGSTGNVNVSVSGFYSGTSGGFLGIGAGNGTGSGSGGELELSAGGGGSSGGSGGTLVLNAGAPNGGGTVTQGSYIYLQPGGETNGVSAYYGGNLYISKDVNGLELFGYDQDNINATIRFGDGTPAFACNTGPTLYINTQAGSASTFLYVCVSGSTWTAIAVP